MTFKRTDISPARPDDKKLEEILMEKRELMNRLRNTLIKSSRNGKKRGDEVDELEFLLKRF